MVFGEILGLRRGAIFIRLAVGLIFLTQGILKYTDPHMGVARFERIGFSHPAFTAHFVLSAPSRLCADYWCWRAFT